MELISQGMKRYGKSLSTALHQRLLPEVYEERMIQDYRNFYDLPIGLQFRSQRHTMEKLSLNVDKPHESVGLIGENYSINMVDQFLLLPLR